MSVDMGPVAIGPASVATTGGARFDGVALDVGNPLLGVIAADPDALDLTEPPVFDLQAFPHGERRVRDPARGPRRRRTGPMRVHERGWGDLPAAPWIGRRRRSPRCGPPVTTRRRARSPPWVGS
ncbi:hypothetical protein HBB16_03245 [Pseudonocardia sp. MCCB 268]|nr:hypothetical protein [Pseudonocardia cytotoxica]